MPPSQAYTGRPRYVGPRKWDRVLLASAFYSFLVGICWIISSWCWKVMHSGKPYTFWNLINYHIVSRHIPWLNCFLDQKQTVSFCSQSMCSSLQWSFSCFSCHFHSIGVNFDCASSLFKSTMQIKMTHVERGDILGIYPSGRKTTWKAEKQPLETTCASANTYRWETLFG